ncbi:MAG: cytochrome c4 [Gammaproteobacteria bacterium]|nr:cytochrome c4 [Gammaproteobacteria bacterium]
MLDPKLTKAASRRVLAAAALLAASGASWAQGDPADGRILAETCLGCHGIQGYMNAYPNYHVPKLGGQKADYIVAALNAYKAEQRPHATMHSQAATLSDEDMQAIAAYFESTATVAPATADRLPQQAAACVACHGETGVAPSPAFPTLAGQYADYLARTLREYKSGERQNAIMAGFAAQLGDEEIEELAAWYAGQDGLVTPGLD